MTVREDYAHLTSERSVAAERFWAKVTITPGCWEWTASLDGKGYGQFHAESRAPGSSKMVRAHRWAYEQMVGPIPVGLELDHLCLNKKCVWPAHLEPVTHLEHMQRGPQGRYLRERTVCINGHDYTPENTIRTPNGYRECRECRRLRSEARRRANGAKKRVYRDGR